MVIVIFLILLKLRFFFHNHVYQSAKFPLTFKMLLGFLNII